MSHVAECRLQVKCLDSLKQAASMLGLTFVEGQKTYQWYGQFMNDWTSERAAAMQGRDPKTFGKCDHAIRLKDHQTGDYEIGVVRNPDGTYAIVYDSWGPGQKLEAVAGVDMVNLKMEYGALVAAKDLRHRLGGSGWYVQTTRDARGYPKVKAVRQ